MLSSFHDVICAAMQSGEKKLIVPSPMASDIPLLVEATATGIILPCFVGDGKTVKSLLNNTPLAAGKYNFIEENDPRQVMDKALNALRSGAGDMIMQGSIPSQEILNALHDKHQGMISKGRLISFVSAFSFTKQQKLILLTDTFINDHPTLVEKQQILTNVLQLASTLGIDTPKTAVLAAIEQINPRIPSTLDAAVLSKMAERHQFGNAIVEGPLDIDCALSQVAAERKGVKSIVSGNADIYLVPEIDTGYLLAEALVFFGRMRMAGVVMGTVKPVILNLPFISREDRIAEIALACILQGKGGKDG